jgi:hypothetical protein
MSNSIPISGLNNYPVILSSDFIAIVNSSSLTTYRSPILSIGNWMLASGSASSSVVSVSASYSLSSSNSINSINSISSSFLIYPNVSTASFSINGISSSYSLSGSFSKTSTSSSWSSFSLTSSLSINSLTSSISNVSIVSVSSSWASSSISSSYSISASYISDSVIPTGFSSGMVMAFAMQTPPTGWLICSGSSVFIADYTNLATAIYVGNTLNSSADYGYKSTDSAGLVRNIAGSYIKLPDFRGVFLRGFSDGKVGAGFDTSRIWATSQSFAMQDHIHSVWRWAAGSTSGGTPIGVQSNGTFDYTGGVLNGIADIETRPSNVVVTYCIKT